MQLKTTTNIRGFILLGAMVAVSIIGIMAVASTVTWRLNLMRQEVQISMAYGNGLVRSGITYYNMKHMWPMTNIDLGTATIPGSAYASAQLINGHFIVTIGDTAHGAQLHSNNGLEMAMVDYSPNLDDQGHLFYTCKFSNSFVKYGAGVSQCVQATPGSIQADIQPASSDS